MLCHARCDDGAVGQMCDEEGKDCAHFVKNCVPEPDADLLAQANPTCTSTAYAGGLQCCHHGRIMLDTEQVAVSMKQPLLRYHMKWRFWYQEYVPASGSSKASHEDLPRIYYQTEARAGEYDIPPAFALPGLPIPGYPGWPISSKGDLHPTPGTTCTGECPDGDSCECVHTIHYNWTLKASERRLIYAGGHCHAPSCVSIELYRNDTGEILCRQLPVYGKGLVLQAWHSMAYGAAPGTRMCHDSCHHLRVCAPPPRYATIRYAMPCYAMLVLQDKWDEADYLALPPCLWGADEGLDPSVLLPPGTPLLSIKKNRNTHTGHFGEMASWQMRGTAD